MGEECCDHDHGPEDHAHEAPPPVLEAELILDDGIIPPPSTEESSPVENIREFLQNLPFNPARAAVAAGAFGVVSLLLVLTLQGIIFGDVW